MGLRGEKRVGTARAQDSRGHLAPPFLEWEPVQAAVCRQRVRHRRSPGVTSATEFPLVGRLTRSQPVLGLDHSAYSREVLSLRHPSARRRCSMSRLQTTDGLTEEQKELVKLVR